MATFGEKLFLPPALLLPSGSIPEFRSAFLFSLRCVFALLLLRGAIVVLLSRLLAVGAEKLMLGGREAGRSLTCWL